MYLFIYLFILFIN